MHRILMFVLLAVFVLLVAFSALLVTLSTETPSHSDAQEQLALEASSDLTLVLVRIGDLEMVFIDAERPTRDYLSLGVAVRDLTDTYHTKAVGRGGRTGIWPGGLCRLL